MEKGDVTKNEKFENLSDKSKSELVVRDIKKLKERNTKILKTFENNLLASSPLVFLKNVVEIVEFEEKD